MRRWFYLLSLAGLIVGCSGDAGKHIEENDPAYVQAQEFLRAASSRILDGLEIRGSHESVDTFHVSDCESAPKDEESKRWEVAHFWQVDHVAGGETQPAIERLRRSLESQGWHIVDYAVPPEVKNPMIRAEDTKSGYVVRAVAVEDKNRVAVRVSAPCFTTSKTGS
ncbi:hypothetical protein [Embleya sp. NBC_00896]|uniref:hypothetical protein n=1 Tax=Embleya sp. NBC_00896 TaxID=2975961 RepID=UPI00386E3433|nr:hypothetical protein OG928_17370 [Embleya sp. NBC_00896]